MPGRGALVDLFALLSRSSTVSKQRASVFGAVTVPHAFPCRPLLQPSREGTDELPQQHAARFHGCTFDALRKQAELTSPRPV